MSNLIPNPRFSGNIAGWIQSPRAYDDVGTTGSVTYDSAESVDNEGGSLKITATGPDSLYYAAMLETPISVTPNVEYLLTAWAITDALSEVHADIRLEFYAEDATDADDIIDSAGGGNTATFASGRLGHPGAWTEDEIPHAVVTAPENAAYALISCIAGWGENPVEDTHVWFDNVWFSKSDELVDLSLFNLGMPAIVLSVGFGLGV